MSLLEAVVETVETSGWKFLVECHWLRASIAAPVEAVMPAAFLYKLQDKKSNIRLDFANIIFVLSLSKKFRQSAA